MVDPILQMADHKHSPQSKNKSLIMKKKMMPLGDLNSDLPIQSQVCLPLDHGFNKLLKIL